MMTSPRSSTSLNLSSPSAFTQATQYSSPSPPHNPPSHQGEGEVRGKSPRTRGMSPRMREVQGVQVTPPSTPASTAPSAPARVSLSSSSSTPGGRSVPASYTGFIMASDLPRSQGALLTPEVLWTKHHDNLISGVCYRLFLKPLDRSKPQKEGSYMVMYSGHTSLYALAVPGGGFNISSFKTHLAREGWGAYSPLARIGNFSKEGTLLPAQSFGSLLSKWFKPDYNDFLRFRKPEVIDISQVFSLGDVLWRLYSCGILDHTNQNMQNLRMQYQLLPLPSGAKKSLVFATTEVESSSTGVVATARRPVDISSSSEDEEEQEDREENERKEEDRASAAADLGCLEVGVEDEVHDDDCKESILIKNKNLKNKVDKLRKVAGKALRCADHFKGRVEKTKVKELRNMNKSITMCVESCVKSKFETMLKSMEETKSVILSLKTESGGVAAKMNLLLKKSETPFAPNFPPPSTPFQQASHGNQRLLHGNHHLAPPPAQQSPSYYLVKQQANQVQGQGQAINPAGQGQVYLQNAGQGLVFNNRAGQSHVYHASNGQSLPILGSQGRQVYVGHEGQENPLAPQGHRGHQAPQFFAPPALSPQPQEPDLPQPSVDLDDFLASLTN